MSCHRCGKVFGPYKPKIVLCHLPEGGSGEIVDLCEECEAQLLDEYVSMYSMNHYEQRPMLTYENVSCAMYRQFDAAHKAHWYIRIYLFEEDAERNPNPFGVPMAFRRDIEDHDKLVESFTAEAGRNIIYDEEIMGPMNDGWNACFKADVTVACGIRGIYVKSLRRIKPIKNGVPDYDR